MPDIGYYTLPVLASFRGITGQIQDQLNKSFKDAGSNAGKIMGQSAGEAFGKDPSLDKAMGSAPASMAVLTSATDKQTVAVGRLQDAHKQLATTMGSPDQQSQVIAVQDKQTAAIGRTETQVKQAKTAHDDLARSIKKVNDEQARSTQIATGGAGGGGFMDAIGNDLSKALKGDTQGAVADLGKQVGAAVGGALKDQVQNITGMSVDAIASKAKGAADAVGVDLQGVLTKAFSGDRAGALHDVGQQLGTKAGSAVGNAITGQVQSMTGLDLGGLGLGDTLAAGAPGAIQGAADWLTSGGPGNALAWVKGGGLGQAIQSARQGGLRGALGSVDPNALLQGANTLTGGGAQPILDMHGGITDVAEGLLGGTAAERFLPAIADAALPIAAGTFLGQKLGRGLQGLDSDRISAGYDDTGTATNPLERTVESIPVVGDFLGPSKEIREANMRARDAQIGSGESFYTSIFGNDRSGIGQGTGGGGGTTNTQEMNVDAGVATISAGSVSLGGSITLPPGLVAGGGGGSTGRTMSDSGGASSLYTGGTSVKTGSSSSGGTGSLYSGDNNSPYFAAGGPLGTDNALFWGTPGEWVIRKPTVDKYGPTRMAAINAGYFAGGGPIGDGTMGGDHHGGPRGSASDPIYTMPSPGYTNAIGQQAKPTTGGTPGGTGGLGGGDAASNALSGLLGSGQLGGIGHQFMADTFGLGTLIPDPTQGALGQAGMNMLQTILGMTMQPGGLVGALTSDAAGKRTFGALLGGGGGDAGGGFGMVPQVAGMPHPDDMATSPAGFGPVGPANAGAAAMPGSTSVDQSTNLTVNGFSAGEVGDQVYRNLGSSGIPNNTPRMNTNMPVGG